MPAVSGVPNGEASVYYDPETKNGSIFLINKSTDENMTFEIDLPFAQVSLWENPGAVESKFRGKEQLVQPGDGGARHLRHGNRCAGRRRFPDSNQAGFTGKVDFTVAG